MGVYRDAETLYSCMGQLFTWAFDTEDLGNNLRASGLAIRLNLTDPQATVSIDFTHGIIEYGDQSSIHPDVDLYMTADTAHMFWLGKLNVLLAVAKGVIKSKGRVAKVLMMGPLIPPLADKYEQILQHAGLQESLIDS